LEIQEPKTPQDDASRKVKEAELRSQLLERVKADQDFRRRIIELSVQQREKPSDEITKQMKELHEEGMHIDKENTTWMKGVIEKHGWPGNSLVGKDGADAAFLLVQHADQDAAFQEKCLGLLEAAVKAKDASGVHLAYLTDRVRLKQSKKQVYGTQTTIKDEKVELLPVEDPDKLDQRRSAIGLPPIAEYLKQIEQSYKLRKPKNGRS
jgi:hypothetical protein